MSEKGLNFYIHSVFLVKYQLSKSKNTDEYEIKSIMQNVFIGLIILNYSLEKSQKGLW